MNRQRQTGPSMLASLLLVGLCNPGTPAVDSLQEPVDPWLEFEVLVTGLIEPTGMAFIGPDDILIVQKTDGRVLRVRNGVLEGAVLDVGVQYSSEQGMLAIAPDPDFINNRFVYLLYTESASGTDTNEFDDRIASRVYRYRWDGSALVEPRMILELPNSFNGAHVSGVMTFGADDKLYIMAGDQGAFGKLQNIVTGNEPDDRGVIFRLNADGSAPPDNPFYEGPLGPMSRYYAYGIRNSFGIAVDPLSGHLWESENGPADYDEVNRVPAGMNGGHRRIRGPVERDAEGEQDLWVAPGSAYKDPQFSWLDAPALTALSFIESRKLGCDYEHDLLVGSYGCRVIYRFDLDATRESLQFSTSELQDRVADNLTDWCTDEQSEILFAVGPQFNSDSTTDIENGPDGLVYVLSYSHGTLKRFQPVPGVLPDADADQVADTCDCAPGDATVYKSPAEVPRLRLAGAQTTTLGWNAQNGATGTGTTYTLVSGALSDLRNDAGFAGACTLAAGVATPAAADDRAVDSGDGFYYLVNAVNGCGDGTFGQGSAEPDPREALVGSPGDPCL